MKAPADVARRVRVLLEPLADVRVHLGWGEIETDLKQIPSGPSSDVTQPDTLPRHPRDRIHPARLNSSG